MALLDLITVNGDDVTLKSINLWEDVMDRVMRLELTRHETETYGAGKNLYNYSIRGLLTTMNIPAEIHHPIMRINGYKRGTDYIKDTLHINIPSNGVLEKIYKEITIDTGLHTNTIKI